MTVERSGVPLTGALTCVPERGEQVLQGDAMETVVALLFARWDVDGICMVLSVLG